MDAVGQITDSGTTNVAGGTSSFTARTGSGLFNDIVLDDANADYGTLSLMGHDIVVENSNAAMATLTIDNATATGDLTITLSGAGQSFDNTPGSNMSIDGKTRITAAGAIDLYYLGCKFGDWMPGDPTDDPSLDSPLYLDAPSVTLHP